MNGFNVSEAGHIVPLILPKNATGGATAQAFSMKNAEHVSIVIMLGTLAGAPGIVTLNKCTSAAGANPVAIGFRWYQNSTAGAGNDTLDTGPAYATASGFTPPNTAGTFLTIELDAAEIAQPDGDTAVTPYLQLVCAEPAAANYVSAVAILSGLRYAYQGGPSQTV